jgi:Tol biopolymer transport system component
MTMRRTLGLFAALGMIACRTDDAPAPPTRTTLVPGPGVFGFQFSKDGRLAFAKLIEGKAAIFVADADGRNARRVSFGVWDTTPFWSPDGKSIALVRDAGGQNDVFIVPADSGAERAVAATSANEIANGWLLDGSALLFTRNASRGRESWAYRVADGLSAKQLDLDGSVDAYPSPDGKWLAYTLTKNGKSDIWLWDRDKKTHRQLTTDGFESVGSRSFSPDGRSLLYYSRRTGTGDLWRIDIATGERHQLTQDIAEDDNGRWSPDGSRVLFTSNRGGQPDLWIVATGESDVQRVTDDAVGEVNAQWSPDGRAVVASVGLGLPHLYAVPLAGGQPVALTSGDWATVDGEVSRDGLRVAYTGTKNGDPDIWVVPVAGGESKLVSGAPGFDGGVTWAPDGKRVAFTSLRGGNPDIWTAPLDSGAAVRLTDWASAESSPRWSPDGKSIAFLSSRESPGTDLWTMPAAGGAATRLTRVGTVGLSFRWSPDGRTIAFSAQAEGAGVAVFLVPAAGGEAKQLSPATSLAPEWRPDGREIKVMQCDKGYCTIDIWSAEGKRLRTLSLGKVVYEFDLEWSSDGSQALVGWQDFLADGSNRVDLRPAAGGSTKSLARPAGFTMTPRGFGAGDRTAILLGGPYGTSLQRIDVSTPAATAKR